MAQSPKTLLAIGAHAGDMEVSCGAVLAKHAAAGDRVVLLHLTLGEGGNPALSPHTYGEQKRREAQEVGRAIGASVLFGPYRDGEIPDTEESRNYVAEQIRQVRPTHIITHWRNSIHRDHTRTHRIVTEAVLLASLEAVATGSPRHRGVTAIIFTENWEDPEGFTPYLFVDVTGAMERWKSFIIGYGFVTGGISPFPYLEYYEALARVRGAVVGRQYCVAFDVDPFEKRHTLEFLP